MNREAIEKLVLEKVNDAISVAIDARKKEVKLQLAYWSGAIVTITTTLIYLIRLIGFTTGELMEKIRQSIFPNTHLVQVLTEDDFVSPALKKNIISEFSNLSVDNYPDVKKSIDDNVWSVISTPSRDKIDNFLSKTNLDEIIIEKHHAEVSRILYFPAQGNYSKLSAQIREYKGMVTPTMVGVFENHTNSKTKCNYPFTQSEKRIILHFPSSTKTKKGDALPWIQCPGFDYPRIMLKLTVEGVSIGGILLVGVERPDKDNYVNGIRSRVTKAVAAAFKKQNVIIGSDLSQALVSVEDVID